MCSKNLTTWLCFTSLTKFPSHQLLVEHTQLPSLMVCVFLQMSCRQGKKSGWDVFGSDDFWYMRGWIWEDLPFSFPHKDAKKNQEMQVFKYVNYKHNLLENTVLGNK